jgi:Xaa-Pro aminopeptidase
VKGVYVNYLPNIKYLTGFTGSQADLIVFKDSVHFFTDDRYEEQIKEELYPLPNLQVHITRDLWTYVTQIGLLNDIDAIIFESDRVSYYDAVEFRNRIRPCKFKPVYNLIEPFTTSKASEEVEMIQKSCRIAEQVYEDIMQYIKPGMTEKEIANEISYLGRKYGSEGEAFDIIVTSGARGAIIHGMPSEKKIRKGDIVLMDFGFKVRGFSSDITRTICVGAKPTREQKQLYATLREAEMKVIRSVLPGMNGKTMDVMVRKVLTDAGYEDISYKHSLGHGLGIMTHERPFLNSRQDGQIVPEDGVLAIEPGAYIPDKYGMRVEDNILVTKNGAVMLTNAPDELPYIL